MLVFMVGCGTPAAQPGAGANARTESAEVAMAPDCSDVEPHNVVMDQEGKEFHRQLRRVQRYADDHPKSFGGMWLDRTDPSGIALAAAFTDDAERHHAELRRIIDGAVPLKVVRWRHTQVELEALQQEIVERRDEPAGDAIVFGVGSGSNLDRVSVDVVGLDDEGRRVLSARFGAESICFRPHPGPGRNVEPGGGAPDVVALPTSDVANMQMALFTGRIVADANVDGGCVWVESHDGTPSAVVWPPGFAVRFPPDGPAELVDHDGVVVARHGDHVDLGGGHNDRSGQRCDLGQDGAFVAGSVRVTNR